MATLICGSLAYDNIMVFQDRFKNHILPEQVHILNVCFLVPDMRREFGGCAGNIAYNLKLLGGDPLPMGTVGGDFGPYADWLRQHGIPLTHITRIENTYTAQAYITTDMDDNQITAFHPGAMNDAHSNGVGDAINVELGIVSPDGQQGMIEHAQQFAEADIPFVFDPGQGLSMFDGEQLQTFVDQASYLTVNDYESQLLRQRTGLSLQQVAERVKVLIVTKGAEGSEIYTGGKKISVNAAEAVSTVDPTGCGDAYRAGLLFGIARNMDWQTIGHIASLMGAIKIEHHGTQNHKFTLDEFSQRFERSFGYDFA